MKEQASFRFRPIFFGVLGLSLLGLFVWALRDPRAAGLAVNTLRVGLLSCAISLPCGLLLALLLIRTDMPWRGFFLTTLTAMLFVPLYLQAAAWDAGFGRAGWLAYRDERMNRPLFSGTVAVGWIHAMAAIPWVVLIVGAALRYVDRAGEETALLDAGPVRVAWRVTARQALPAVFVAGLWVVVLAAGEMVVSDIYAVRTYAEEIYIGINLGEDLATSIGTLFPAVPIVMMLVVVALASVAGLTPPDVTLRHDRPRPFRLGAARWPALLIVAVIVLAMAGVPLGNLVYKAGILVEQVGGERHRVWSARHALAMIASAAVDFRAEILWTFLLGALSASAALVPAVPLAWLGRRGGWGGMATLTVCAICLAIPGPQVGRLLIWAFNREGSPVLAWLYDQTLAVTVLAVTIRCLPLVLLIVWFALRGLPEDVMDHARLDGMGAVRRCLWIALPQRKTALLIAWVVGSVVAMGDVSASILVVPPGVDLVPVRVFGLVHQGVEDSLAGLCLLMVAVFAAVGLVCAVGARRLLGAHTRE